MKTPIGKHKWIMLISCFLEYISLEKKYSRHTVVAYRNDLISFKEFCISEYNTGDLLSVEYTQIRSWIVYLVNLGITNNTINRKVSSLKSFYVFLQKTRQIEVNPLKKHKALKVMKKVQIPFAIDEINKVIDVLATNDDFISTRDRLIVELLYSTGIRRIELVNLTKESINFYEETIKVLGKRNKERIIPLISSIIKTIKEYMEARKSIVSDETALFITDKGNKIYETLVYRVINNYFATVSAKVKKSPHILRHSFATHLLNRGADINSVKELLGHSSLASTQVYTYNSLDKIKQMYNQAHPRSHKKSNI